MLTNRVGTFFILVGLALIGLFVVSDLAKTPSFGLLLFGAASLGLGVILWARSPSPPPKPSGRFRILKGAGKKQPPKK